MLWCCVGFGGNPRKGAETAAVNLQVSVSAFRVHLPGSAKICQRHELDEWAFRRILSDIIDVTPQCGIEVIRHALTASYRLLPLGSFFFRQTCLLEALPTQIHSSRFPCHSSRCCSGSALHHSCASFPTKLAYSPGRCRWKRTRLIQHHQ
jgi:hypothetical protein